MKLSETLKDWPEETKLYYEILGKLPSGKNHEGPDVCDEELALWISNCVTSCDREIDREALVKALGDIFPGATNEDADLIISTIPTWLKKVSEK